MVILEQLRIHVGGLVCLKTELYWYGGRGWDRITDRTVLLMDACAPFAATTTAKARAASRATDGATDAPATLEDIAAATLLLIDGRPHWVWVGTDDLELL